MMETETAKRAECALYREIASDMRSLVPKLRDSEAAEGLRILAVRYEKLADYLEVALYPPTTRRMVPHDERS
jgi:hypothetical protein